MKKHLANIITLFRLLGVAVIFLCSPFQSVNVQCDILLFYILLAGSDWIDGKIARSSWGTETTWGKILDSAADKMLFLTFLPLIEMRQVSSTVAGIIIGRHLLIFTLRLVAASKHHILGPRWTGKYNTAFTLIVAGILLARVNMLQGKPEWFHRTSIYWIIDMVQAIPQVYITLIIWFVCLWTVYTIYDYFSAHWKFISFPQ